MVAGRIEPYESTPALGSYERWRDVIGGILRVAEIPGFLDNQGSLYEESDGPGAWAEFLEACHGVYGDAPFTVAQVTKRLREDSASRLHDALPPEIAVDLRAPGFSRRLGHAFARQQEVRFERLGGAGTIRIARAGEQNNAIRWRVICEP